MRLNIDCVRDILLCIENIIEPRQYAFFHDTDLLEDTKFLYLNEADMPKPSSYQNELLAKYPNKELIYHLNYCVKANLIELLEDSTPPTIIVNDLTPKGHDFIENIRYDSVFEKTKQICKDLGVKSLSSFVAVAENVTSEIIKSYFISS